MTLQEAFVQCGVRTLRALPLNFFVDLSMFGEVTGTEVAFATPGVTTDLSFYPSMSELMYPQFTVEVKTLATSANLARGFVRVVVPC